MAKTLPPAPDNDDPISPEERDRLFELLSGRPLALCVSGGADSMALMHLVADLFTTDEMKDYRKSWWNGQKQQDSKYNGPRIDRRDLPPPNWLSGLRTQKDLLTGDGPPLVVVLTIDHALRPGSAGEAEFVASEARKLGLPHQTLTWPGEKPTTGIQEAARNARYRLLLDLLQAEAAHIGGLATAHSFSRFRRSLVMAHHQEDQAETVLMRLARGSGLEGLAGMRREEILKRQAPHPGTHSFETLLLRPFLDIPKSRLVATLKAGNAEWIEDPSNDDSRFERVRVRKVMEDLKPLGFTAEKIALSARRLRDVEDDLRDEFAAGWRYLPPSIKWNHGLFGEVRFEHSFLDHTYLVVRTLRQLLSAFGGASKAAELAKVEALAKMLRWPGEDAVTRGLTLGGCKIEFVGPNNRTLRIYREGQGEQLPELKLNPEFDLDWDGGRYRISTRFAAQDATVRPLRMEGWAKLKKEVPKLETLRWPAAAMATMPVISENGEIVTYPVLDDVINNGRVLQAREDWLARSRNLKKQYNCRFCAPTLGYGGSVGPPPAPN